MAVLIGIIVGYLFLFGPFDPLTGGYRLQTLLLIETGLFCILYAVLSWQTREVPSVKVARFFVWLFVYHAIATTNILSVLEISRRGTVYSLLFSAVIFGWLFRSTRFHIKLLLIIALTVGPLAVISPLGPSVFSLHEILGYLLVTVVIAFVATAISESMERNRRAVFLSLRRVERKNRLLKELSERDELTGLFNRRVMMRLLRAERERGRRYEYCSYFLLFDLDTFKKVNDTLGHAVGDRVLREVASVFSGSMRESDTVARFGGEEFAVLLPNTDSDAALQVAERIRKRIEENEFPVVPWSVTVSCGGEALRSDDDVTPSAEREGVDPVLRGADRNLYAAKHAGRNRVVI